MRAHSNSSVPSEFLHLDPDTNMVVCMILDEDGFRPAHATEEALLLDQSALLAQVGAHAVQADSWQDFACDEALSLNDFVGRHQRSHAYQELAAPM